MKNSPLPLTTQADGIQEISFSPFNSGVTRSPMSFTGSNPEELLPERVVVEFPLDERGDPQKKIVVKKSSNKSPLDGLVFDRSMTLTGMIADGVSLSEVHVDFSSNDPNDMSRKVESDVLRVWDAYSKVEETPVESAPVESPVVESPKSE